MPVENSRRSTLGLTLALAVIASLFVALPTAAAQELACDGAVATIVGTESDDTIAGTDGDDVIVALGGNDRVEGGAGNDIICGGDGDDRLDGGADDDRIFGGEGDDGVYGGGGVDVLHGDDGDDWVRGGEGDDTANGGAGDDHVKGEDGDDRLEGNQGDDFLDGGEDIDDVDGGAGFDACAAETTVRCETDDLGPAEVAVVPVPLNPEPLTFPVNTAGFDGVELTVESTGGLYPWDIAVQPAYTRARMRDVIVSELIDITIAEGAPSIASATLTMSYDPTLVVDVPETALRIWTYDEELQFWLPAPGVQTVDTTAKTVTAELEHFSVYAVLEMDEAQPELWRRVIGDTPIFCVPDDTDLGVDVAFAIDTSGSMGWNDPGNLRVTAAQAFVETMREGDQVGVVSFSSGATTRIGLTLLDTQANRDAVNAAISAAGFASGGTNITAALDRTTAMLAGSEVGRPRITILLTDGVGTYSTADANEAAAENVTVYTIGLGGGVNSTILSEIATITGGEYIQLESADQLIPLYEELGGTIFDDGTDSDGDDLTDCIETNGAFVPAVALKADRNLFDFRIDDLLEAKPSYITTNPDAADTDGDNIDDGVELVAADLRDNILLQYFYGFLIEEGITAYYREISDPNDPFDPGVDVPGELDFLFEPGLLSVDGLNIDDTTLFQPDRYPERPVIDERLLGDRINGSIRVRKIDYDFDPVVFDAGELCVENCAEVERLANERNSDNGFLSPGCSIFGNDFECEVKQIIRDARGDQNIFESDDDLNGYFVQEQTALQCAVDTGNLDDCVRGAFNTIFINILPNELDLIVDSLTAESSRWLKYRPLLNEIGVPLNLQTEIRRGDMTTFVNFREHILTLWKEFAYVDSATGPADGFITESDFYGVLPDLAGTSRALEAAIDWFDDNRVRLEREHNRIFEDVVSFDAVQSALVFSEAFDLAPAAPRDLLEQFPLVGKGGTGIDIYRFAGREPSLRRLFDKAMAFVAGSDRVRQNEYVSRLPETTAGIRNELITAVYVEYGQKIQSWLGPAKGGNWGLVAPWASNGVNGPIRGEFPVVIAGPQQAAADGNQWIFRNIGSRYAAFVEVITSDPSPSERAWENFFEDNFGPGDATLRDGFVALVAAQSEPDLDRAQELMFQSNVLLATHEQEGVQLHLEKFDTFLPDTVENWFINLRMGASVELDTDLSPYSEYGLDPNGPAPAGNRVWPLAMLSLDPTGEDASFFSTGGFTVAEGQQARRGIVDVDSLSGIEATGFAIGWDQWRSAGGTIDPDDPYAGADASVWWDWEERMWYLTNLFRILHTNAEIEIPPAGTSLASQSGSYSATTLAKLGIG